MKSIFRAQRKEKVKSQPKRDRAPCKKLAISRDAWPLQSASNKEKFSKRPNRILVLPQLPKNDKLSQVRLKTDE